MSTHETKTELNQMAQSTVEYPNKNAQDKIDKAIIRILHVDDETDFLKAAKQILEVQELFQVDTASCVEEAMEKMKKKKYDAIVSDYIMSRKSGLDFLKGLRDSGSSIPFIIFTGKGREEVAIQAMNLGADRYVNKIGDPEVVYSELAYSVHHAVERRRAQERLKEEMKNSSRLLDIMPSGLFTVDLNKMITSWNKAAEKITGLKEKNVVGKNCVESLNCDTCRQSCGLYSKDVPKPIFGTECVLTINGKELLISKNADYIKDTYGKVIGGVESFVDMTKLKKAEKMLIGNEEYLETILNSIFSGVVVIDAETHEILDANPRALETIGASREHVIGKVCHSFICPAEKGKCPISDLEQTVDKSERVMLRADGERIPILKTVTITNWKGHKYLIESLIDITERKKSEEVLRESEERYRNLFENSIDVTLIIDLKGTITSINKAAEKYGFKKEDIIGENQLKYVPKKYWPRIFKELVQIARGKTVEGEIEINTPKGKKIADYRSNPILIGNKVVGVQVVLKDITERRMTEEELKRSEERFETMMEEAPIAVCNTDLKGKITYVNRRFEEVTGYSRDEIVGKSGWRLVSDETSRLLKRRMKERLMGNPSRLLQGQFKTKDGKWIWIEMESKVIKKLRIPVGFQHVARDITERKTAEKELAETLKKLETMNEKLSVVGKLTRHDARNKLSVVTMSNFLVKRKLTDNHEALGYLSEIESACKQVERIFDFAGVYEMLGAEELIYMDVERSFKEAVSLLSGLRDIDVVNQCQGLTVLADSLLRQLFYNLIDNSLKHGEQVSQIRVYYEKTEKAGQLKLVYEDDGVGISKAEKEKIFKEGYGRGMGYGLYLIMKMCEVYGWTIRETGKPGRGAQFTITIPRKDEEGLEIYKLN